MKQDHTQPNTQLNSAPLEVSHAANKSKEQPAQSSTEQRKVRRCANCDIEFFWSPTVVQDNLYCCTGCAAGGPCTCDYSLYRSVTIMGVIHYDEQ
jgi:hypothetical protein